MLDRIIGFSLRRRAMVAFAAVLLVAAGVWSAFHVAVDAVPDITSPQVQVNTAVPALAPEEIELQVTALIEMELAGLPGMTELRSLSKFGLSQVTMTFADGADLYLLRQLVTERLALVLDRLPEGVRPGLAPVATGLGEVVYYTVDYAPDAPGKPADRDEQLRQLRIIHDYTIKPMLRGTPGLAEVNAIGGHEKQIVIAPDPGKLAAAGVSLAQIAEVIRASTANAGGGILELGGETVIVRADTRARTVAEIADLPVKFPGSARPLLVRDLAEVGIGSATRTGAATENGEEAVVGSAIMLAGGNSRLVARDAVVRLGRIQEKLPGGIEIRVVYDRSDLVRATIGTVEKNLTEGALLVAAILLALLGHWRAALLVALAIPLSFLFMLTGMARSGLSANLMSLGAIDFGLIVDGSVVIVENILRHLAGRQKELGRILTPMERAHEVHMAAREVVRPMFFGVTIITLVYVPILALTGIEGKMFRPMALSVMLALAGSLLLALTLMPALASWFLGGRLREEDGLLVRGARALYRPLLARALRFRLVAVAVAVALFGGAVLIFPRLGAEFIPQLDEGSLSLQMIRGNSVALGDSVNLQKVSEKLLLEKFPEISHIFSRIGTAEIATDAMGPNVSDTYVFFNPRETWREIDGHTATKEQLIDLMRRELVSTIPGQTYLFTQPIQMRFNEIMAGARADLSLKIYGTDFAELERIAGEARDLLRPIRGGGDVEFDALGRVPMLEVTPRRDALQRLNLHADEINEVIAIALAGGEAGTLVDGNQRFDAVVRLPEARRLDLAGFRDLPVITPDNVNVPLSQLADIAVVDRVGTINRENTQRRVAILINVRGRDTEGFVTEASETLDRQLNLPPGYYYEFGGQFENLQAARVRLAVVVPLTLALIFALIYASFGSARQAALVYTGIPLAVTGGVFALWVRGIPFSISAAIGFIALSGVAVLNGVVMVSFFNQLRERGRTVREAVVEGALTRLRPVLMTALVASLGFVPMAVATGSGAEVQRPLATVVIGGILSATFLTLVLLPALYDWVERDTPGRAKPDSQTTRKGEHE